MITIDLNSDLGEGIGNDAAIMPFISSCNIACGGHIGDEVSMRKTIRLAIKHSLKIGAHPSFPDRLNFGRKEMNISHKDLSDSLQSQLLSFTKILSEEKGRLHHIKPHGALYNLVAREETSAALLVKLMLQYFPKTTLYAPYNSVIAKEASNKGIKILFEAFADRNYNDDLSLVSRSSTKAIITDKETVFKHVKRLIVDQKVLTVNGNLKIIKPGTVCVHGDNPHAIEIVRFLDQKLQENNIKVE